MCVSATFKYMHTKTCISCRWIHVAEQLYFTYNAEKRYHEEFEGYDERAVNGQCHYNETSVKQIKSNKKQAYQKDVSDSFIAKVPFLASWLF